VAQLSQNSPLSGISNAINSAGKPLEVSLKKEPYNSILAGIYRRISLECNYLLVFDYLKTERGYSDMQTLMTMVPAVIILAAGYPVGGALGDRLFKKTPKGRVIVGAAGVAIGAVFLWITMKIPIDAHLPFAIMLFATAFFSIPFRLAL